MIGKPGESLYHLSSMEKPDAAAEARELIRSGTTAALGTLDRTTGGPYVSLITVAPRLDLSPVTLLSALALHTRNLAADPRASVLYAASFAAADPLALSRVTLFGTVARIDEAAARQTYLARHPQAAGYADFGDFAFYVLHVERAHYIGGFGRIVEFARSDLISG
jgi:putative heme iron utilization protein